MDTEISKDSFREALKLLREAELAINDELISAGEKEVKAHPVLKAHYRVFRKIQKFLNDHEE